MEEESMTTLQSIFTGIGDPRAERTKRHQLLDIVRKSSQDSQSQSQQQKSKHEEKRKAS